VLVGSGDSRVDKQDVERPARQAVPQGRDLRWLVDIQGVDLYPAARGLRQVMELGPRCTGPDRADDAPALLQEFFRHGVPQPAPGGDDQDRGGSLG
jgi:hypothetical protein